MSVDAASVEIFDIISISHGELVSCGAPIALLKIAMAPIIVKKHDSKNREAGVNRALLWLK